MSEDTATPSTGPAAVAPGSGDAVSGGEASALTGSAPGGGVDAVVAEGTPAAAAVASAAKFRILNREFNDQRHAEEILGSEIGKVRGLQRQNAELMKAKEQYEAELGALRELVQRSRQGQGQGGAEVERTVGPGSFAKELAENGELDVIAKIFADPEMGPAHAMYRMAELLDERNSRQVEQVREELRGELSQREVRSQQERAIAKAISVTRSLARDYPELDESNQSDEAIQAQQGILQILQSLPQGAEWLASDPEEALRYAAERYRRSYGTPVFAQPPGTSGSPSVRAAAAAEQVAAGQAATPLDGSGVPRQRASGQPESPIERIRRENREVNKKVATTPSGRPLGFELPS